MDRVFVDTDILLDVLDQREPFYSSAAHLLSKADQKELRLLASALSFTTLHYLLRKKHTNVGSRKILLRLKSIVQVISVGEKIIDLALTSEFNDFEDAVQYYCAIENKATTLITRNLKDYKHASLPVMTAEGFMKMTN
jgi:predicted nucleic acid-binding protein